MEFLAIAGGIVVIAVILLVVGLSRGSTGEALVEERLGRRERRSERETAVGKAERRDNFVSAAVDRAVEGRSFAQNLATQLAQADLKWTVGEFLVLTLLLSLLLGLAFYGLRRYVLIPVGVIVGFFAPRVFLGSRRSKRLKEFNNQLGDALNLIVNSLRAGYSTVQALEVIASEMPKPISTEFGRVVLELQLGASFDVAMANLMRRMPSADMDLIITAMSVQREVGGNLAEVLDAISFTIRERVRIKGEIRTLTAQGRYTGYLITGLPFVLGGVIYLINPEFMGPLFSDPCGWLMVGISLVLIVIGYISINKIVSIEV
ncbi:MAG: type II secretion system F family protein [Anaerolineae bacterium]|jgi:tight adherence protein B|nr:type II secretion system F family protein [Anaerolineae bacterium]